MSNVMPWHIAQSPWALEFDKFFPDAKGQWDHPSVKEALRKQAVMIALQTMKGKNIKPSVQKMAEFVLGKFIPTENTPQMHVTLTLDQILELKRKAGLKPEFKTIPSRVISSSDLPSNSEALSSLVAARVKREQDEADRATIANDKLAEDQIKNADTPSSIPESQSVKDV